MIDDAPCERRFDVEAKLESIPVIQASIEAVASRSLDRGRLFRLNMAVEELVTNVVRHSGTREPVGVAIRTEPGSVSVELTDAGAAFDPFTQAALPALDASVDERPIGGLGVHLVKSMMDTVEYRREDGRNHVVVTMRTEGAAS